MIRDHILFTYFVSHEQKIMVPDPEAPGGGEMVHSGEVHPELSSVNVIAQSRDIADAWLYRPFSGFDKLRVVGCVESKIDAFVETHTW